MKIPYHIRYQDYSYISAGTGLPIARYPLRGRRHFNNEEHLFFYTIINH